MTETVLFISPTGTMDNGAEISIFYLMKSMVEKGYRVLNAFPDYHVPVQEEYKMKMQEAGVEVVGLSASKWWWEEAPGGLPGTHYQRIKAYQKNIQDLQEVIRNQKVDLVITNTVNVFQGAIAAAYENIRHFWLIHEFPEGEFGYYREKLDFIDHFSDKIFAVTGALREEIAKLLPHRNIASFMSYSHLDEVTLQHATQPRIVQVGRITDNKNQLELIKAYHLLGRFELQLLLIGAEEESYAKKCRQYVLENHLTNVHFLGYRENPWQEVTDKDICVFTSKVETFGMVYIEALLNSVPTIISNNRGYQSVKDIFSHGEVYELGNIESLSKEISKMLEHFSEEKQQLIADKSRIQKLYSIDSVYEEILSSIEGGETVKEKDVEAYIQFLKMKPSCLESLKRSLKGLFTLKKIQ